MDFLQEIDNMSIYNFLFLRLTTSKIKFGLWVHPPVRSSEEAAKIRGVSLEGGAKAMLFKDTKSEKNFLAVLSANKRVSWKLVKAHLKIKKLELANELEVGKITKCLPGAIPPFGSLFGIQTLVDPSLIKQGNTINFNAGLRTHSFNLKVEDYLKFEKPEIFEFAD